MLKQTAIDTTSDRATKARHQQKGRIRYELSVGFSLRCAEFAADVFVFTCYPETRGRATRCVGQDAGTIARFEFATMVLIGQVPVGVTCLLTFGLGLPVL